jgi:putative N6-adenine-specific DNA methylase
MVLRSHRLFIGSLPGLEPLLADEVRAIGANPESVRGGVEVDADDALFVRLFRQLGVAAQILERKASFPARHFSQLERRCAALPWKNWIAPTQKVVVRARSQRSKLYHSKAIEERVAKIIGKTLQSRGEGGGEVRVLVHLRRDQVQISLDRAGLPLHKRGYRQATSKAPLREDVARALLLCSGWDQCSPVFDPLCGSGTLAIEAQRLAQRIAPGGGRAFAWQSSPDAPSCESETESPGPSAPVWASDRDKGAIEAAKSNALRAGVEIECAVAALGASPFWARAAEYETGLLICNPPYGRRVSKDKDLAPLFHRLRQARDGLARGWSIAMVSPPGPGPKILGLRSAITTEVGGQKVSFWVS